MHPENSPDASAVLKLDFERSPVPFHPRLNVPSDGLGKAQLVNVAQLLQEFPLLALHSDADRICVSGPSNINTTMFLCNLYIRLNR